MSLAIETRPGSKPKLPLWHTICGSYSTYFHDFGDVLRICWLWLVIAVPVTGVSGWTQAKWMADVMSNVNLATSPQINPLKAVPPDGMMGLEPIGGLLMILAGVSIAVAWHRRVILGEHPRFSGSNVITKSLWSYVGIGIAIFLIAFLPLLVIFLFLLLLALPFTSGGPPAHAMPIVFSFVPLLTFLFAATVMLRLSLLLPARAVGDSRLTFKEAWKRTSGNTWRMFWGLVGCTALPMLVLELALLPFLPLIGFPSPGAFASDTFVRHLAITGIISTICYLLILPIGIGFLSLSYRHFSEQA